MVFKVMIKSLIINLFLTIIKLLGGILGNSKTLVADAIHSLTDLATDIIALIGNKFSLLPPDKDHPYGHGKYEYVTSIIISFIILFLSLIIFYNSFFSKNLVPSKFVLYIILFSLIIKILLAKYIMKKGKQINNSILLTSGLESKYDALSSLFALIFVFISTFANKIYILKYVDIIGGVFISLLVFKIGLFSLKQNIKTIIGEVDNNNKYIDEIKEKILKNKDIKK